MEGSGLILVGHQYRIYTEKATILFQEKTNKTQSWNYNEDALTPTSIRISYKHYIYTCIIYIDICIHSTMGTQIIPSNPTIINQHNYLFSFPLSLRLLSILIWKTLHETRAPTLRYHGTRTVKARSHGVSWSVGYHASELAGVLDGGIESREKVGEQGEARLDVRAIRVIRVCATQQLLQHNQTNVQEV